MLALTTVKTLTKEEIKRLMKNKYIIVATCVGLVIVTLVTSFIIYKMKEVKKDVNSEIELMSVRNVLKNIKKLDEADRKSLF